MSRASKLVFKWGLVVLAVALTLSLVSPNTTFARDVDSGPIVVTDPGTEFGGDNDGVGGYKGRRKILNNDEGTVLTPWGTSENDPQAASQPKCYLNLKGYVGFALWWIQW